MPSNRAPVEIAGALRQHRDRAALAFGDLAQPLRVRGVRRADHDQGIDHRRHLLHRQLPVGGGVADVFLVRARNVREALLQHDDDFGGVVDRQRGLGDEGEIVGILGMKVAASWAVSISVTAPAGNWPSVPTTSGWCGMADQEDFAAALEMDRRLAVHLGDQRTGGVEREEIAGPGIGRNRLGNPVGREHHRRIGVVGDLGKFLDENRALGPQAVDDIAVVDDLVTDIDRSAVDRERPFHGIDRPHHPGTEARAANKARFSGLVWLAWERSRTESRPAGGRERSIPITNWDWLADAVKAVYQAIARPAPNSLYRA